MRTFRGVYDVGEAEWRVYAGDDPLPMRLDLANHSPTGFSWGYGGSGPAQLALALACQILPDERALKVHQALKWTLVARWRMSEGWEITEAQLRERISNIHLASTGEELEA